MYLQSTSLARQTNADNFSPERILLHEVVAKGVNDSNQFQGIACEAQALSTFIFEYFDNLWHFHQNRPNNDAQAKALGHSCL